MSNPTPALSIVIPCGPGEAAWPALLDRLARLPDHVEIILSSCEPKPGARLTAGARWIEGSIGRAAQLNRGVRAAGSARLWLLHADSEPDQDCVHAALRYGREAHHAIGWFDLDFAADGPAAMVLNAWGANLRSRWFKLPFGDQGWLLPRSVFDSLGGFDPAFGRGEDLEFMVRASQAGIPLVRIGARLRSSARRYREHGWLRTTFEHLALSARLYRRALKSARARSA